MTQRILALLALLFLTFTTAACREEGTPGATGEATPAPVPATLPPPVAASSTPIPPTPTPTEPLAARVNGELITLVDFERELARYQAAQTAATPTPGAEPTPDPQTTVLDALIERELIRQAAAAEGVTVSAAQVEARLAELRAANSDFAGWLAANDYTEDEFRAALAAEMVAGEMVARLTAGVPTTAEQVRARYIQVDDAALAQSLVDRARAGDDFAFLADQNSVDRVTGENGGDLGFFARGGLVVPEVEAAAFALQPGETSEVIAVTGADGRTVYYIVQVTEREAERPLTADARHPLLQAAFDAWLADLRATATIERLLP